MLKKCSFVVVMLAMLVLPTRSITPLAGAQQGPPQVNITLTPYEGNPILVPDRALAWEAGGIAYQRVVAYEGVLYLFYQGYTAGQRAGSVGYATSEDGLNWTKYEGNPVFVPDKTIAPNGVMTFAVALDGDTWTIYFSPWPSSNPWYQFSGTILVATAPSPAGPWTINAEPLLSETNGDAWDVDGPIYYTVIHGEDGDTMFYNAGEFKVGMATSEDGITWTKYDDPATTSGAYATSDPVFGASQEPKAWDGGGIALQAVRLTDQGWEMFYAGGVMGEPESIGYATSPDGITWTRVGDSPLLSDANKRLLPKAVAEIDGSQYLYYVVAAMDFSLEGIAVATITYH